MTKREHAAAVAVEVGADGLPRMVDCFECDGAMHIRTGEYRCMECCAHGFTPDLAAEHAPVVEEAPAPAPANPAEDPDVTLLENIYSEDPSEE